MDDHAMAALPRNHVPDKNTGLISNLGSDSIRNYSSACIVFVFNAGRGYTANLGHPILKKKPQ